MNDFKIDEDKYYFARTPYGKEEMDAVVECMENGWLGPGKYTAEFEESVAKLFDKKHGVMVNSGSSALLLAAELLDILPGDEIITCATGFPTTINPFLKRGAVVLLADTVPETLSPDIEQLESLITTRTKAIVLAHVFGATLDMPLIRAIADKYEIKVVEDSCDSLGATINGESTGHWSDISVTSFYASHIITAGGGGGMICVNSDKENEQLRIKRDWGRYEQSENLAKRLDREINGIPYDGKFIYDTLGFNLKATEIQAAFGLVQLKRLPELNGQRLENYEDLSVMVTGNGFSHAMGCVGSSPSWLTFPFYAHNAKQRKALVTKLELNNIQTRPILAGNFLRQPVFMQSSVGTPFELTGADYVAQNGIGVGLHSAVTKEHLNRLESILGAFRG